MSEWDGSRNDANHILELLPVSQFVNYLAGDTADQYGNFGSWMLTNPGNARKLVLWLEAGQFRIRPGQYGPDNSFNDNDITIGTDVIVMTGHDFNSGDGPYQISLHDAEVFVGTSIVIDDVGDTFTRTEGSWLDDGFVDGATVTVANSASNNGAFTIATGLTDLVMEVDEDITVAEGAQTDLTMTAPGTIATGLLEDSTFYFVRSEDANSITLHLTSAAAGDTASTPVDISALGGGGLMLLGSLFFNPSLTETPASGQTTDGYNSLLIDAAKTQVLVLSAPDHIGIMAVADASSLSYWWVP